MAKYALITALLSIGTSNPIRAQVSTPVADSAVHSLSGPIQEGKAADVTTISYTGGQLRIHALNLTLPAILKRVAAVTGVQIEIPEDINTEPMPFVEFGPGSARQVLASLLGDSKCDYLIQGMDTDSEKLQSVIILPRSSKGSESVRSGGTVQPLRSNYPSAAAPVADTERPGIPDSSAQAAADNAAVEANASNGHDLPAVPEQPEQPAPQRTQSTAARPPALTPPPMDQGSITQQLQQMYQQRMQMIQQERQQLRPGEQH